MQDKKTGCKLQVSGCGLRNEIQEKQFLVVRF